jgi:catalase
MDDKPALTTSAGVPIAENQNSRTASPRGHTFSDIKEFANEQDVQIFAIGTLDFGAWAS